MPNPRITKIEIESFTYELSDLGRGEHGPTYSRGKSITNTAHAITISTDVGVTGEYVWSGPIEYAGACVVAELLIGQDPLEREYLYSRIKQTMRQQAEIGISAVDIALWDLAGKYHEAPIHQLLGGYRKTLPTYPASVHATERDELKSPEEMAGLRRAVQGARLPRLQDPRLGERRAEPRGPDDPHAPRPRWPGHRPHVRPLQRAPYLRRRDQGRARLRRGRLLLVRRPAGRRRHIAVRPPQAPRVARHPAAPSPSTSAASRPASTSWSTARPTSSAATSSTWASPQP